MIGLICGAISIFQLAFADKQERNLYKGINLFIYLFIYILQTLINKTYELPITLDLLFLMFH